MAQKGFRHDINALRAFAVISVVLYHFQVSLFASGYIGVDIFFVISGFLMTKAICSAYDKGKFSLIYFFFARAKRIIPALLVLCAALLVFGGFYLLPIEYRQLGKHIVSSQLFISNIIFSGEAGYFDVASTKKYLLHTWSLSVEWQFYLLLPLILVALLKVKKTLLVPVVLLVITVLSFLYALNVGKPQTVYFSLLSRAWEMILGSLFYFLPSLPVQVYVKKYDKIASLVLFTLLFASVIFIGAQEVWPNYWALLPIFATALLIWLNSDSNVYSFRPIEFLGEVSYSLYLWHWPIVVFLLSVFQELTPTLVIAGVFTAIFLSFISYKYIETPTRGLTLSYKSAFLSAFVIGVVCLAAIFVYKTNGLPWSSRWPSAINQADLEFLNREPRKSECLTTDGVDSPRCIYGENNQVSLIVFGDSHASAIVTAVEQAMPANESLLFIAKAGCPSLVQGDIRQEDGGECRSFVAKQLAYIKATFPSTPVLVIARWPYYFLGKVNRTEAAAPVSQDNITFQTEFTDLFSATWCEIAKDRKVFALSPLPEYWASVPEVVAKSIWQKEEINSIPKQSFLQRSQFITQGLLAVEESCGVYLIDAGDTLCNETECRIHQDSRPIYYDDNHLSEWGNKLLVPVLKDSLNL